jgi:acyl-coenzyme A thioesterase PaaI-like protein
VTDADAATDPAADSGAADEQGELAAAAATGGPDEARRVAAAMRTITSWLVAGEHRPGWLSDMADELERLAGLVDGPLAGSRYEGPLATGDGGGAAAHPFVGAASPLSPPITLMLEGDEAVGRGRFSPAYEGPPGAVHGGYVAGVFDVVLGMAARAHTRAAVTGTLTIHYHRPTPLGEDLVFRARLDRLEGKHLHLKGQLFAFEDFLTAEAEAVFVATRRPGFSGPVF